jgi:hypothetical protein
LTAFSNRTPPCNALASFYNMSALATAASTAMQRTCGQPGGAARWQSLHNRHAGLLLVHVNLVGHWGVTNKVDANQQQHSPRSRDRVHRSKKYPALISYCTQCLHTLKQQHPQQCSAVAGRRQSLRSLHAMLLLAGVNLVGHLVVKNKFDDNQQQRSPRSRERIQE